MRGGSAPAGRTRQPRTRQPRTPFPGAPASAMEQCMTTLITGATGFVGSAVARTLARRGHALRLLTRATSDRRNLEGLDAEIVIGDLTDPASLARAAAGCRYVVHVAADYRFWVPDAAEMMRANVDGALAMVRAAA